MARSRPLLLHADPDCVLIAVDAYLANLLHVSGRFALAPKRPPRPAEVPGLSSAEGFLQRGGVHVRNHEHLARLCIGRHAGDKAIGIELRSERAAFFDLLS